MTEATVSLRILTPPKRSSAFPTAIFDGGKWSAKLGGCKQRQSIAQNALLNQSRFHIVNYLLNHQCVSHCWLPLESVTQFVTFVVTLLPSSGSLNVTITSVNGSVFAVLVIWWIAGGWPMSRYRKFTTILGAPGLDSETWEVLPDWTNECAHEPGFLDLPRKCRAREHKLSRISIGRPNCLRVPVSGESIREFCRPYSGSTVTVLRSHRSRAAFSSRKSHFKFPPKLASSTVEPLSPLGYRICHPAGRAHPGPGPIPIRRTPTNWGAPGLDFETGESPPGGAHERASRA
jgi:hypothetical protein